MNLRQAGGDGVLVYTACVDSIYKVVVLLIKYGK
jgi:hypothetical protein